ncbi:stalk domain-containing protein [Brevibacillus sp. SYSU BS000544]|uniref:stalk domain-containing protein n=1 Tax=Brevibacillus sp. SYSU BS000544 TaxID=3416443 RepID=UPI003CE54F12
MKKKLMPVLSTLLLVGIGILPSSTNASMLTKTIQANYHDVKVMYNGTAVTTEVEPFIVNGTTYIPVRMMAGVFNKDITWNGSTYTINVQDRVDPRIASLQAEIAEKDAKIEDLQQQLDDLEDEEDDEDIDDLINDLEDELNDNYGDYADLEWDISISGDEDDIDVEIEIDLDEYAAEYDDLDTSDIEDLIESITEDIWYEFEDADVNGVIIDTSEDEELHDFYGDASEEEIELDGEGI